MAEQRQGTSLPPLYAPEFVTVTEGNTGLAHPSCPTVEHRIMGASGQNPALGVNNGVQMAGVCAPFSLGPGHTPIPAKLVSKILTGQFVELADLIPENLDVPEQVQHTITGSSLVSISPARPKRKEVIDVVTWVECFVSFMSVVMTYAPPTIP